MSGDPLADLLAPWRQVAAKADAFFAGVQARHGAGMRCGPGCAQCCQVDRTVLAVEALVLYQALEALPSALRQELRAETRTPGSCPLLHLDRCVVYESRPIICRTHGLPLLQRTPAQTPADARDEAELSVCPLNFTDGPPPPDAILNGELLTAALTVADGMVRQAVGVAGTERVRIWDLVVHGRDAIR